MVDTAVGAQPEHSCTLDTRSYTHKPQANEVRKLCTRRGLDFRQDRGEMGLLFWAAPRVETRAK